jgi:hypothetical protein
MITPTTASNATHDQSYAVIAPSPGRYRDGGGDVQHSAGAANLAAQHAQQKPEDHRRGTQFPGERVHQPHGQHHNHQHSTENLNHSPRTRRLLRDARPVRCARSGTRLRSGLGGGRGHEVHRSSRLCRLAWRTSATAQPRAGCRTTLILAAIRSSHHHPIRVSRTPPVLPANAQRSCRAGYGHSLGWSRATTQNRAALSLQHATTVEAAVHVVR